MLDAVSEAQRGAITVAVFIVTFFVAVGIGRFLKRRAGVQLGVVFRLFCLIIAFYAAIAVYGVDAPWRYHIGAAAILLSTALVVALVNRYVWDFYFEKKRQTPIPNFLREVVGGFIFLIVLLLILSYGYHAETQLKGLLAGSGLVAIILGFAGQNLFAGIIGGISIQINRPYKVGDWLKVGDTYGEVREINWRSTRLCTNDQIYLDIPNNEMVSHQIVNLHYPTETHAMRVRVGIDYNVPPNRVKDVLGRAAQKAKNVLPNPPVRVYLVDFSDYAMTYEIKFFMGNHSRINETNDSIRTNVWYELKRQGISIPLPTRTLHVERKKATRVQEDQAEAFSILRGEPLFDCLTEDQLSQMVNQARLKLFGRGEPVIEEGAAGDSMFVMLRGAANVLVSKNGSKIQVAKLSAGDCFGEMSLLTGEPRSATVRADGDCYVMEIGKPVMAEVLSSAPSCMEQLSQLLAQRRMETEGILKEASGSDDHALTERQYTANFLNRLRTFFQL
ncbi:MAG TPA: mechanosensitive ion channel family protein [Candidatus Udaeobacter sp.]|jgi:small-conductance mechanosensitive channel/CRP-like cAMP-binding protein|nr:mechanosensitive ion channel family protein [Candidatus Udaeobacter sp.]